MLNSNQAMVAHYRYDPFGNTILAAGALASQNVYRFSSKALHNVSGFYYYGYRWYDPTVQRWLNRDPLGEPGFEVLRRRKASVIAGGANKYRFVLNNPVSKVDALGLQAVGWPGSGLPVPTPGGPPPRSKCPCGEAAAQIAGVGPIDANTARRLANEALAAAQASGLPGLHNGQADAFRHCFWSCRMAQEIGADQAKQVGDTHERCSPNPANEEAMDQANNATGRGFGTPGANCGDACMQAVRDGTLQTSPDGTPPLNPY
jgi:RHS repeat-associated protein